MEQKTIGDITSLTSAVNRLLEHVGPHTQKTCASNIHKTVNNLLFAVSDLLDGDVTRQLAALIAKKDAAVSVGANPVDTAPVEQPADGSIRISPQQVLDMNIGVLGLPMRLEIPLQKAGFRKIRDLCAASLESLRDVDGVGSAGLDSMMEALEQFGVSLTE